MSFVWSGKTQFLSWYPYWTFLKAQVPKKVKFESNERNDFIKKFLRTIDLDNNDDITIIWIINHGNLTHYLQFNAIAVVDVKHNLQCWFDICIKWLKLILSFTFLNGQPN